MQTSGMGKQTKKDHAIITAGMDISRYLKPRPSQSSTQATQPSASAGIQKTIKSSPKQGNTTGPIRTPGEKKVPTQTRTYTVATLLDNTLLSQDLDDLGQVIWAPSPQLAAKKLAHASALQPPGHRPADKQQASDAGTGMQDSTIPRVESDEVKRAIIDAVAGSPNVKLPNSASSKQVLPPTQLIRSNSAIETDQSVLEPNASASATDADVLARGVAQQGGSNSSAASDSADDSLLQQVLEWSSKEALKTPSTNVKGRVRAPGLASWQTLQRTAVTATGGRRHTGTSTRQKRSMPATLATSSRTGSESNKRRALLDILNQVEVVVQHTDTPSAICQHDPSNPPVSNRHNTAVRRLMATPPSRVVTPDRQTTQARPKDENGHVAPLMFSLEEYEEFFESLEMDLFQTDGTTQEAAVAGHVDISNPPDRQPLVDIQNNPSFHKSSTHSSDDVATKAAENNKPAPLQTANADNTETVPCNTQQLHKQPIPLVLYPPDVAAPTVACHTAADGADNTPPQQITATQQGAVDMPLVGDRRNVHYQVLQVDHGESETTLRLYNSYQGRQVWAHLQGVWQDLPVQPGDTLNLVHCDITTGPDGSFHATATSTNGTLVVLHPDILLSGTTITSAMDCSRKAWLSELLGGGSSTAALQGTLLHEVVQAALDTAMTHGSLSQVELHQQMRVTIAKAAPRLYEVGLDGTEALADMLAKSNAILAWLNTYVRPTPQQGSELIPAPGSKGPPMQVAIKEVCDIEENIWAPRYGLKGQLDASLCIRVQTSNHIESGYQPPTYGMDGVPRFHGKQRNSAPAVMTDNIHNGRHRYHNAANQNPAHAFPFPATQQQQQHRRHSWGANQFPNEQHPTEPVHSRSSSASSHPWAVAQAHPSFGAHHQADNCYQEMVVPFEFKSGRHHFSHAAQVLLYQLLMSDRYSQACDMGLLWNVNEGPTMRSVGHVPAELSALMQHRNRLAAHLVGQGMRAPPPMADSQYKCSKCFSKVACSLIHKAIDRGNAQSSGMGDETWYSLTSHLTDSHCAFFAHWFGLVELEESQARARRPAMWSVTGPERQAPGVCLAGLQLMGYERTVEVDDSQQHCYVFDYVVTSKPTQPTSQPAAPQTDTLHEDDDTVNAFENGEMLVLSQEGQHTNVARVTLLGMTKSTVHVLCKKRIRVLDQVLRTRQAQTTSRQCVEEREPQTAAAAQEHVETFQWRLDKDEPAAGSVTMRKNLVDMMSGTEPLSTRLRQLVIDLAPPGRQQLLPPHSQVSGSEVHPCLTQKVQDGTLNRDQAAAVSAILEMQDYALVLGMPGTGKTSTIVEAVTALLNAGRSILITAYTNSAVDNICLKLASLGLKFVRVPGSSTNSIHPDIRAYTPGGSEYPQGTTASGFLELVSSVHIVATTCLGLRHPFLARRTFDVCILDEASQVSLPASLGPLLRAKTWVLVGDHHQLPPLVTNREAAERGYGESLFRRLCEAHPQAVVTLRLQYRMAEDIMQLSNHLIYNGSLQCGSQQVAHATLRLPHMGHLLAPAPGMQPAPSWLLQALDPSRRVVFLDTHGVASCQDITKHDAVSNAGEASVVHQLVTALVAAGLPGHDIGIVSTYRAQVSLIQKLLKQNQQQRVVEAGGNNKFSDVEVLTIDKYQGRDKPCIILSFVRNNAHKQTGRLLTDWQRINVALTRAKHKLIILGGSFTLAEVPVLSAMLQLIKDRGRVMPLPSDCALSQDTACRSVPVAGT